MKRQIPWPFVIGIVFLAFCLLCGVLYAAAEWYDAVLESRPRCASPSADFSASRLVGKWRAGTPNHSDVLILRDDGMYKQVIHIELAEGKTIEYESDWQPWRLEYEAGIPYLHLTGFAFCGMNDAIPCQTRDGDGHDFCRDRYLPMHGEGILIVLETPLGGYIYLHYPLGTENSYAYRQVEP